MPSSRNGYVAARMNERSIPPDTARGSTRIEEPTRAERTIARRAAEARATVPDVELSIDVDVPASVASADRTATTALLVSACARALREFPRANGAYRDGRFELYARVNVGVVVATDDGYVVPTIFDADTHSLAELRELVDAATARAVTGQLTPPEQSGATFVLVDLGAYGVGRASTIIGPPHAATLAAGAVRDVAVVRGGDIVPGHAMTITLVSDHRILYGAQAARFLSRIGRLLEEAGRQ
jgi:pyruvate dehydrogenase E2 component (dihydrolipoamide acetyltransferase)